MRLQELFANNHVLSWFQKTVVGNAHRLALRCAEDRCSFAKALDNMYFMGRARSGRFYDVILFWRGDSEVLLPQVGVNRVGD